MKNCYYIGKKRRKRHPFLFFLFILCALLSLFNATLYPKARALVESRVTNRLSAVAADHIARVLEEEETSYASFVHLSYGTDGAVRALSVDTVKMALLKQRLALSLLSALQEENVLSVSVPLGNLTGILPLSGVGRPVSISVKAAESLKASFVSSFTDVGINQTRHIISFSFEITVRVLLGGRTETVTLVSTFPAAETVIVGEVPDSLTQISRLTDGVTEYEIDDAVDFGNVLGN